MSEGNPHLSCGTAENGHYVATCGNCHLPLIEHSMDELSSTIQEHLDKCQVKSDEADQPR